jgi:hypothetical protein
MRLEVYGLAVSTPSSCEGAFKRAGFFTFRVDEGEDELSDEK